MRIVTLIRNGSKLTKTAITSSVIHVSRVTTLPLVRTVGASGYNAWNCGDGVANAYV